MTHEEAVANLKILKEDYWDDDGYGHESKLYDDTELAIDMAIKALEDSRWIPITERLPDEEHKKYVVTLDNGEVENRWWLGGYWVESVGRVIAWRKLPEAYEGE